METISEEHSPITLRLALCAGAAAVLYGALERWGWQLLPEEWQHRLSENKVLAIGALTAALWILWQTLAPEEAAPPAEPCGDYERTEP